MVNVNIYIDGTWLFKQCQRNRTLAQKLFDPSLNFAIDFNKLKNSVLSKIQNEVSAKGSEQHLSLGDLFYFTSIIKDVPDINPSADGEDLIWLKNSSYAKQKTAENAENAGFDISGVFERKFQAWMPSQIAGGTFQEKKVDTSLVARIVLASITKPSDFHVIISGDLDMLPAISLVVPQYLDKIVLASTHPQQWDPNDQQSSNELVSFNFKYGPLFLDQIANKILVGNVYSCSNCGKLFSLPRPLGKDKNPTCKTCLGSRPSRKY